MWLSTSTVSPGAYLVTVAVCRAGQAVFTVGEALHTVVRTDKWVAIYGAVYNTVAVAVDRDAHAAVALGKGLHAAIFVAKRKAVLVDKSPPDKWHLSQPNECCRLQ